MGIVQVKSEMQREGQPNPENVRDLLGEGPKEAGIRETERGPRRRKRVIPFLKRRARRRFDRYDGKARNAQKHHLVNQIRG